MLADTDTVTTRLADTEVVLLWRLVETAEDTGFVLSRTPTVAKGNVPPKSEMVPIPLLQSHPSERQQ